MTRAERGAPRQVRRWILVSLIVLSAAGAVLSFILFDEPVVNRLLRQPDTWYKIGWVNAFRQIGKAYVLIWLLLLWSCVTNRWRSTVVAIVALVLVSLSVGPLKLAVPRDRPNRPLIIAAQAEAQGQNDPPQPVSFPSGDTADVFAVATVVMFLAPGVWAPGFFAAAGAIGLLRVISLAHYPSDVFAGALIGLLAGCCAMWIAARWLPESEFRLRDRWRLMLGLLLVLVVPVISPIVGMGALLIFFKVYGIPAVVLMPVYAHMGRVRQKWLRGDSCALK